MTKYKKFAIYSSGLITGIGLAVASVSGAIDSIIPYQFKDGDVISADTLNDLFTQIKNGSQGFQSESDLAGDWTCTTYDPSDNSNPQFQQVNFTADSASGLQKLVQTWSFTNSGRTLTVDKARLGGLMQSNTGVCPGVSSFSYSARVVESALMLTGVSGGGSCTGGTGFVAPITKLSPYRFRLTTTASSGMTVIACIAQNQPPEIPSNLSATASSSGVALTWTDNGGAPTEFVVYKKTNGSFAQVATTTTNAYTDATGSAGNLYRVQSKNANGNSMASSAAIAK